jgi:hypothetical protein
MDDDAYRARAGTTLRGILNDLKRNPEAAAAELEVAPATLGAMIDGRSLPWPSLVERAATIWPVNERDFYPIHDDAPTGVLVMRAAESVKTSRMVPRNGHDYYEYRDTAMSRVSTMRPEWIRMLRVVDRTDPDDPAVEWNHGHFLFQFTYFVGAVNYYYAWQGRRFCLQMSTGDSIVGVPYAPHSFTSRDGRGPALILALTYGGRLLGDAQHELGALGPSLARGYALPNDDARAAAAALLRLHATNAAHSPASLAALSALPASRVRALWEGDDEPSGPERDRLAAALHVPARDLMPIAPDTSHGIRVARAATTSRWDLPEAGPVAYRIRALAATQMTPLARGLEVEVVNEQAEAPRLQSALHEYGYHLGDAPVRLRWWLDAQPFEVELEPDDSFYVKPFVPHVFVRDARRVAPPSPRLLLLRSSGRLGGDAIAEASLLGTEGIARLVTDTRCWYEVDGTRPSEALTP